MNTHRYLGQLKQVGGRLCLDFINTVDRGDVGFLEEWLTDAIALINWGQQVQLLTPQQAEQLRQQAQQQPKLAQSAFERAIELREVLYHIFSAVSAGQPPLPSDLAHLNEELAAAYSQSQLVWDGSKFVRLQMNGEQIDSIVWQIVKSTEELLLDPMLDRVRECAGIDCGWIFLDTSRNHSRRWCDMEDCGNRAKARRHYNRSKR